MRVGPAAAREGAGALGKVGMGSESPFSATELLLLFIAFSLP